ncbi:MAG: radical SAM protein [Thermofilaceae archaeon]
MRIDWPTFAVKPSSIISALCYSIFRLEPYRSCPYGCVYCYASWYRSPHPVAGRRLVKQWRRLAEQLGRAGVPPPYFRLSTLAEPFQNAEAERRFSLEIMRAAYENKVPLVVNTKSIMLGNPPWLDALLKLAEEGLVLVQVSVAALDEKLAHRLEPSAPPPSSRLALAEELSEHGVPVVARVQPLIPGIEDEQVETARSALEHGCRGVIVEPLRETMDGLVMVASALGVRADEYVGLYRWEPYSPKSTALLRPGVHWRARMLNRLQREIGSRGVVTVCKDGFWPDFARYGHDCCQAWHMAARYSLRKTVFEHLLKPGQPPPNVHLLDERDYEAFPRPVRRGLKLHHNKLCRVLESGELLARLIGVPR